MTSRTDRLLAALRLRRRKPEADVSQDPARRRPGPAGTASLGTTSGPREPHSRPAQSPGGDRRPTRQPASDDVTSVIAAQHEHIKALLKAVRRQTGHRRAAAFHTLRLTLALHETAEEQTAGQTIGALEMVDVDSDQFNSTFGHLATDVTDHAGAEEADEWPALGKITDPAVINAMVEQMRAVTQLAADPSAPGIRATFSEMQDWAKSHLPTPPGS